MSTGLVIHISSGDDRHTEILSDDSVRIGASESCDLRLRSSSLPKTAANTVLLELSRKNGSYRVTDFDPAVALTLNGQPVNTNHHCNYVNCLALLHVECATRAAGDNRA